MKVKKERPKKSPEINFKRSLREKAKLLLSSWLVLSIRFLNRFDRVLTQFSSNDNERRYEHLGPSKNAVNNEIYESALLWALKDGFIRNIALTGPYGSGKSSVISTFQNKQKQFNYLNISLATFNENIKKENPDWRSMVELSILQQLIYHVKNKKLPDSRFKKIRRTSTLEILLVTLGLVVLGVSSYNLYNPEYIAKFSWWKPLKKQIKDEITYATLGIFFLGISIIFYKFYRSIKTLRLSKLGITKGDLEFADKEDKSIFNKHLDEIIYFFEVNNFDVIVIEDLDRFDDAEIFTKLREVNNLINNSDQIGRPVNFIYAVRDDMFRENDRAKFFDYIIPIIPIINTSNSGDKLRNKLTAFNLDVKIPQKLLNIISLYIQDMRLLTNIINEFKIYQSQIGKTLEADKLLSIIIVKNLYPEDFAQLHSNKGDIYQLFISKKKFIASQISIYNKESDELSGKYNRLEAIKLCNIEELRSVYIAKVLSLLPPFAIIKIDHTQFSVKELLTTEYFNTLQNQSNIFYDYHHSNYGLRNGRLDRSFSSIENDVHDSLGYYEREQDIVNDIDKQLSSLSAKLAELDKLKSRINSYSLKDLIAENIAFEFEATVAEKQILIFFIAEGYIDELYPTYISFFEEGSLSKDDMDFVTNVSQRKNLEFNLELKNIPTIVEKMAYHKKLRPYGNIEY